MSEKLWRDNEEPSYQTTEEMSLRRKSVPRGMIFRWFGGFLRWSTSTTRVWLVLYYICASTEFEVWSEYNRFPRIIPTIFVTVEYRTSSTMLRITIRLIFSYIDHSKTRWETYSLSSLFTYLLIIVKSRDFFER